MITPAQAAMKRTVDVVGAVVAIVLFSPILIGAALAVKLTSSGPVLFKQKRLGKNGVVYDIFKLRTMVDKAPDLRNPDGSTITGKSDPRVTNVGKVFRKLSIDEIPQLFNVLFGTMSLVGPRPDKADQRELYAPGEEKKLLAKPGMTGLAMIRGRNAIPWKQRIAIDIEYIENYSLWLDFKIMAITVPVVVFGRGVNAAQSETSSTSS